jgi:hypothetical protein
MSVVIAFDIGIRNLAWCCYNSATKTIIDWENYDLLHDSGVEEVKQLSHCSTELCTKAAKYTHNDAIYCTKHCVKPILKDLSGNQIKKIPTVSVLQEILKTKGSKPMLLSLLKQNYSLPIIKLKATKKAFDMEGLHDSLRKFVLQHKDIFSKAQIIGLENQPVLTNPTMKTVQVLLYATLRDILVPIPKMKLIHALKKASTHAAGEAGYKDRKNASIERANAFFRANPAQVVYKEMFDKSVKKADLADCLSMCIDMV